MPVHMKISKGSRKLKILTGVAWMAGIWGALLVRSSGTQTSRQELEEVQTFIGSRACNVKGRRNGRRQALARPSGRSGAKTALEEGVLWGAEMGSHEDTTHANSPPGLSRKTPTFKRWGPSRRHCGWRMSENLVISKFFFQGTPKWPISRAAKGASWFSALTVATLYF